MLATGEAYRVNTALAEQVRTTRQYFDSAAPRWDDKARRDGRQIEAVLDLAGLAGGAAVLDVGCGTGVLIPHLLARGPRRIRAIDLSSAMVALARAKHRHSCLTITASNFYTMDEGGFDFVLVYNAYPHFLHKNAFAQSAWRCLRPGGRLVIAHGIGRERLNSRHSAAEVRPVSAPLLPCAQEAARLPGFHFDIMKDSPDLYVLSGTRE